ncbi:MAG: imidazoleglycerol-phosphate dehydratase HisB [Candidatus Limnocylindria bacterium]
MTAARTGSRSRKTKETAVAITLKLDAKGRARVSTGIPFMDHMLELVAVHGLIDLSVKARGDLHVDQHHTVEDLGLVLGRALDLALGDRGGIVRFASLTVPMDECLVNVAIDLGGRPALAYDLEPSERIVGSFDTTLMPHFLESLAQTGRLTLHITQIRGGNPHHLLEATMKGLGRVIDAAARRDPRRAGKAPSSKGRLGA